MNIVDSILLVLLLLFGLRGYFKGLFRESFSLLGLIIGFMVAVRYDEPAALLWPESWRLSLLVVRVLTFVGLFFVVYFTFSLAGWLLHRSAKFLFLQSMSPTSPLRSIFLPRGLSESARPISSRRRNPLSATLRGLAIFRRSG
ncbi:MAG: CvpA family protein [Deltaproteobacteria bacterium]|nr:CvpA family protein [Deltaproteobacteria bacterium]